MPIRQSGYFNDPQIGQAFANLSSIFDPPSGADAANWAEAAIRKQKLSAIQGMLANPNDPLNDRRSTIIGTYAPNQSFYAVDQGNATTRRGQDITAATTRETNAADNTRALQQTTLEQAGQNYRADTAPLNEGQVRAPGLGDKWGVQGNPTQGIVKLSQGQTAIMPGGQVVAGQPVPLTMDQWQAQQAAGLRDRGAFSDQELTDRIFGNQTPVMVVDPRTKQPVYMAPGAAARTGAQAFVKPDNTANTEITKLIAERDTLPPGSPDRQAYDARIAALGRGQQQSKYDQVNDEGLAKLNSSIYETAITSSQNKATLDRIKQLLAVPNTDTGAYASARTELRKVLNAVGINAGDTSNEEVIRALASQFALKLRDPSQGAGMPGSMSDSDRAFLAAMSAGLDNSAEANAKILDYYGRVNDRNIEIEKLRAQYEREHGRIDNTFRSMVSDYAAKHPLFPEAQQAASPTGAPAAPTPPATGGPQIGQVEDGFRFKGGDPSSPQSWEKVQ